MNYLKYYFHVAVVMSWLGLYIRANATRAAPTGLKQDPAPLAKLLTPWADSPRTQRNPIPFSVRRWSTAVLTLLRIVLSVAPLGSWVRGITALRLVGPALPDGGDAAPFATAPCVLARSWA